MLGEKVLDATQYPQINFTSSLVRSIEQKKGATEIQVEGTLRLHGVEKTVVLLMRVHVEQGDLSADGEFSLLQSDYGIVPVKAGGGAVRVKDELKIRFHIVAGAGAASSNMTSRQFGHTSPMGSENTRREVAARAGIGPTTARKNAQRAAFRPPRIRVVASSEQRAGFLAIEVVARP